MPNRADINKTIKTIIIKHLITKMLDLWVHYLPRKECKIAKRLYGALKFKQTSKILQSMLILITLKFKGPSCAFP